MKNITKINLFILVIALYQTSYCSQGDISQSSSPAAKMFSDVLSQPVEQIISPLSLQHPDHIQKTTSQEHDEFVVYVQHNSTQTNPKTIKNEIEDLIQFHCNPQNTNLFIVGDINGIHYKFSTLNNQRYLKFKEESKQAPKIVKPFLQKILQEQTNRSNRRLSDFFEELEDILTDSTLIDASFAATKDVSTSSPERRKPSKRITYNPNVDVVETVHNNSTYLTTKNCLIGSLTVATVMTGYLMLKNRK